MRGPCFRAMRYFFRANRKEFSDVEWEERYTWHNTGRHRMFGCTQFRMLKYALVTKLVGTLDRDYSEHAYYIVPREVLSRDLSAEETLGN